MSAYVVSISHIRALVTAGLELVAPPGPLTWPAQSMTAATDRGSWTSAERDEEHQRLRSELTADTAGRVGAMLFAANVHSVNHRYDEDEWEPPYDHVRYAHPLSPVDVLCALDGYEYQACEHPDWWISEAAQFCNTLRRHMITQLPGYGATWHIDDESPVHHS